MTADNLTKPFRPIIFKEFMKCLGLITKVEVEHNLE